MRHFILALSLSSFLPCTIHASDPVDPALRGLHKRWAAAMKTIRVPGLAVVAVRGDEVVMLDALGIRDPNGAKPVTPDTYFYIASCTKPYSATVLMQLVEQGKVDLDAPVKKYLPRLELAEAEATDKLTVRDLLTHRQGLNNFPVVFLDAFTGEITEDRYFHFLKSARPRGQVGYSNIHFTLTGRIIEAIDGKGWREALDARLFAPAKMTRTTGYASKMYGDPDAGIPLQEKGDGWAHTDVRKTDRTMHAAGGLGSTARDLGRWLRLNINGGRIDGVQILKSETITLMHTRQTETTRRHPHPDFKIDGFGLGWQVGSYRDHRLVSHGGGYAGCAAFIAFIPERKIGVAVLANTDGAGGALAEIAAMEVLDRLLGPGGQDMMPKLYETAERNRTRRNANPAPTHTVGATGVSLPLANYAGTFENAHWGTLKIAVKDGTLNAHVGDYPVPLKSTGADRFQVNVDSNLWRDARFEIADGKVPAVILIWNDYGEVRFARK